MPRSQCDEDLDSAPLDLDECLDCRFYEDADGDGEEDSTDACPNSAWGAEVDDAGCTRVQFCEAVDPAARHAWKRCVLADWRNDSPVYKPEDCRPAKSVCEAR